MFFSNVPVTPFHLSCIYELVSEFGLCFLYPCDRETYSTPPTRDLLQKKRGDLSNAVFKRVSSVTCAVCGPFREGKPTPLWCHEPPADANCGPDWNLGGTAGEPGAADSCCKRCCVISRLLHRGMADVLLSEILCGSKVSRTELPNNWLFKNINLLWVVIGLQPT